MNSKNIALLAIFAIIIGFAVNASLAQTQADTNDLGAEAVNATYVQWGEKFEAKAGDAAYISSEYVLEIKDIRESPKMGPMKIYDLYYALSDMYGNKIEESSIESRTSKTIQGNVMLSFESFDDTRLPVIATLRVDREAPAPKTIYLGVPFTAKKGDVFKYTTLFLEVTGVYPDNPNMDSFYTGGTATISVSVDGMDAPPQEFLLLLNTPTSFEADSKPYSITMQSNDGTNIRLLLTQPNTQVNQTENKTGGGHRRVNPYWYCSTWSKCGSDNYTTRTCVAVGNPKVAKPPERMVCRDYIFNPKNDTQPPIKPDAGAPNEDDGGNGEEKPYNGLLAGIIAIIILAAIVGLAFWIVRRKG